MNKTIYVINPNSSQLVTDGLDDALQELRIAGGPEIKCLTLESGPPGIQSQYDADSAGLLLAKRIQELDAQYGDAAATYVIACFSDPGLFLAREITNKPVLGISESGILTAMTMGHKLGIIAILQGAINRHSRMFAAAGVASRIVAEIPLGLGVQELSNAHNTKAKLREVGSRLKEEHHADVLVLGCAGMASYRKWLEDAIQIPVVDPTQAAVSMAIGRVLLSWK